MLLCLPVSSHFCFSQCVSVCLSLVSAVQTLASVCVTGACLSEYFLLLLFLSVYIRLTLVSAVQTLVVLCVTSASLFVCLFMLLFLCVSLVSAVKTLVLVCVTGAVATWQSGIPWGYHGGGAGAGRE